MQLQRFGYCTYWDFNNIMINRAALHAVEKNRISFGMKHLLIRTLNIVHMVLCLTLS